MIRVLPHKPNSFNPKQQVKWIINQILVYKASVHANRVEALSFEEQWNRIQTHDLATIWCYMHMGVTIQEGPVNE